jgi:3-phenylpropionate/trans-cinnamate dioxygenase ferredoxin component
MYVRLGSLQDLAAGMLRAFETLTDTVCVAHVDGGYYAFSNECPHAACPLVDGELTGHILRCTCHGSEFDIITGQVVEDPAQDGLLCYPVRALDGNLEVEIDSGNRPFRI